MISEQALEILMKNSVRAKNEYLLKSEVSKDVVELAKECKWPPYNIKNKTAFNG